MSLDSTATNIGIVLLVVGVSVALSGRKNFSRRNRKNRDMGVLLAIAGVACMARAELLS